MSCACCIAGKMQQRCHLYTNLRPPKHTATLSASQYTSQSTVLTAPARRIVSCCFCITSRNVLLLFVTLLLFYRLHIGRHYFLILAYAKPYAHIDSGSQEISTVLQFCCSINCNQLRDGCYCTTACSVSLHYKQLHLYLW
jgi:hypothetical protein